MLYVLSKLYFVYECSLRLAFNENVIQGRLAGRLLLCRKFLARLSPALQKALLWTLDSQKSVESCGTDQANNIVFSLFHNCLERQVMTSGTG